MSLKKVGEDAVAAREARKAAGKSSFNADKTRYIQREFLGWVCYAGRVVDGSFSGVRVGVVADESVADEWLNGKDDIRWDIPAGPGGALKA